jgi:CheY-like chemotaxis protein
MRVLLVEDSESGRLLFHLLLRDQPGVKLESAENGECGAAMFAPGRYDVVFMDLNMPGVDGLEATRRMRSAEGAPETGRTPIVAMSAHDVDEVWADCAAAGCTEYMAKPFTREVLDAILTRLRKPAA